MAINDVFDLVVVGSGVGGLATALTAARMGLKVLVIEKGARLGGGTAVSHGGIWIGANHLEAEAGIEDSEEDTLRYMEFLGGDQIDMDKARAYVRAGNEALRFYEGCGLRFQMIASMSDHYYPSAPGASKSGRTIEPTLVSADELGEYRDAVFLPPNEIHEVTSQESVSWGGMSNLARWDQKLIAERRKTNMRGRGSALIVHFLKAALAAGVSIRRGVAVDRLQLENGRVSGVVTREGETIQATYAVAIATGGYESNPSLVRTYEGLPGWQSMFPDTLTGDGMAMATEIGAAVDVIHNNMALFLGFVVPAQNPGDPPFYRLAGITELLFPHTMVVNKSGRRFADETYFQSIVPRLREYDPVTHDFANLPCFFVFDSQFHKRFSFAGRDVGAPIPDWVRQSDTIEGLAAQLGIDPAELARTRQRYNQFAGAGEDLDFGRGQKKWSVAKRDAWGAGNAANPTMGMLSDAPYYGIELHPSAFCSAGVRTNTVGQVMHQRGHPIQGLYAVGNASGHRDYGVGYQAGYSLASGMTFGYLAARHMAGTGRGS